MPSMPDAIILCGGAGRRLKSITGDGPKAMANIAGRPFLELLLRQVQRYGFRRVILATGHQDIKIRLHFGDRAFGLALVYSVEQAALGTGGALGNAAVLLDTDIALVMNGDSYTDVDLSKCVAEHRRAKVDVSLVVVSHDGRVDSGLVLVNENEMVEQFSEKRSLPESQYVNAGVYVVSRALLSDVPVGAKISLEEQLLPQWLKEGKRIRANVISGACVDIGTPERYYSAQHILANVEIGNVVSRSGM